MNQESQKRVFAAAAAIGTAATGWGLWHLFSQYQKERSRSYRYLVEHSQVLQTAKGPIEVSISGSGPPVLVVHGAAGGYDQGKIKSEEFDGITSISVSRPGSLRTPLSTGRSPAEQADAMAALLDVLEIDKTIFIGTSMGGLVGLFFALNHPQRCKGLVLISAVNAPLPLYVSPLAILSPLMADDFLPWTVMNTKNLLRVRPDLRKQLSSQPEKLELIDQLLHTAYPTSMRLSGLVNDGFQVDHLEPLPLENIHVPTLVIHGTKDEVVPFSQGVQSASRISGADFIPIFEGTHYCALTHHEVTFPAIKDFIAEVHQST
ncbi:MAG: alpha/beta hydrolase [Anaerolineales bacterium]